MLALTVIFAKSEGVELTTKGGIEHSRFLKVALSRSDQGSQTLENRVIDLLSISGYDGFEKEVSPFDGTDG